MTRDEILEELREVLDDIKSPYLWSDLRLIEYLAEGQDLFCEETGLFIDQTNYTLTLEADTFTYPIDERIIQVLAVFDGGRRLRHMQASDRYAPFPGSWGATVSRATGRPGGWYADAETGMLMLDRTPTTAEAGETLRMRVWRRSRNFLADTGADPELPIQLQRACVEWAAYKAYNHHDMESQDLTKMGDHAAAFKDYVTRGKKHVRRLQGESFSIEGNQAYRV